MDIASLNCCVYNNTFDNQGRPIVYVILRNFNFKKISEQ